MRLPELSLSDKIKLILHEELLNQIDYAHKKIGSVEWSGFLLYKQEEGNFESPSTVVLKAYKFFPLDVGTTGHTEFNMTPEAMESLEDTYPDYMDYKIGLIHTHHNMSTFFSGEDMNELHDNTANYPYYLSLIVNFAGVYAAKVAFIAKETDSYLETNSFMGNTKIPLTRGEKDNLILIDCNIQKERIEYTPASILVDKWNELKTKQSFRIPTYTPNTANYRGHQTTMGFNKERDGMTNTVFPRRFNEIPIQKTIEKETPTGSKENKEDRKIFWKEEKGMMLPLIHPVNVERILCKIALLDPMYKNRDYMHQLRMTSSRLVDDVSRDQYFTSALEIIEDCMEEELAWAGNKSLTYDEICYTCTKLVKELETPTLSNIEITEDMINLIISYCNELYIDEMEQQAFERERKQEKEENNYYFNMTE
tara:strand:- start:21056 stop:22324 length:1269 start_codon:yes stop_codon:yes gene_type:complete